MPTFRTEKSKNTEVSAPKSNFAVILVLVVITGLAGYRVYAYMPAWENDLELSKYCTTQLPGNSRVRKNYGGELSRMVRPNALPSFSGRENLLFSSGTYIYQQANVKHPSQVNDGRQPIDLHK